MILPEKSQKLFGENFILMYNYYSLGILVL